MEGRRIFQMWNMSTMNQPIVNPTREMGVTYSPWTDSQHTHSLEAWRIQLQILALNSESAFAGLVWRVSYHKSNWRISQDWTGPI